MAKLLASLRPDIIATAIVVVHALLVSSMSAEEPRLARRRGTNVQPSPAADRAFKPVDQIRVEINLDRAALPEDRATEIFSPATPASPEAFHRAEWHTSVYAWAPPEFFYRPLYFDDVPLERYGHSVYPRLQPAVSTVKYFGDVLLLPYRMVIDAPHQWVSPLGYDRPGSDAEPVRERGLTLPGAYPRRPVVERPILEGQ